MASDGRPMQPRSLEILDKVQRHLDGSPVVLRLTEAEMNDYFNFYQRCRTVARRLGVRISVRRDRKNPNEVTVRVLPEEPQQPSEGSGDSYDYVDPPAAD